MREAFERDLARFGDELAGLAQLAEIAMTDATSALLDNDIALAGKVIDGEQILSTRHDQIDEHAVRILARQQPVAGDLRTIVAGLRMSADLQRMGRLATHVAEVVKLRHPRPAVPIRLRSTISAMGAVATRLAVGAREAIQAGTAETASKMDHDDDEMDHLLTFLYHQLPKDHGPTDVETVMDLTLLGRYYERFADHAVGMAKRVAFAAGASRTGLTSTKNGAIPANRGSSG